MEVNQYGQLLYKFGKGLEKDLTQLKNDMYMLNNSYTSTICFGLTNYIGVYLMPPILSAFKSKYPMIAINFTIDFLPNIVDRLNQNVISFALIPEDRKVIGNPNYFCEPFCDDEMVLTVSTSHPLASFDTVEKEEILKYPFLISHTNSATRNYVVSKLKSKGITLKNTYDMYNTEAIKQGIINDLGISILSRMSVLNEERSGLIKVIRINDLNLTRKLYIIYLKDLIPSNEDLLFMKSLFDLI